MKYLDNEKVIICHHDNLRDRIYRQRDQLHLTDHGTSRLANNLKFKIAESLGIRIEKKRVDEDKYSRYNRSQDERRYNNYRNNIANYMYSHNSNNNHNSNTNENYHQHQYRNNEDHGNLDNYGNNQNSY